MSQEEQASQEPQAQVDTAMDADRAADVKAIFVIFTAAVLMALHMVSGFTFDF